MSVPYVFRKRNWNAFEIERHFKVGAVIRVEHILSFLLIVSYNLCSKLVFFLCAHSAVRFGLTFIVFLTKPFTYNFRNVLK